MSSRSSVAMKLAELEECGGGAPPTGTQSEPGLWSPVVMLTADLIALEESTKMKKANPKEANAMTGRDGAVDYAARTQLLNPGTVAHNEGHTYRVIELVGT